MSLLAYVSNLSVYSLTLSSSSSSSLFIVILRRLPSTHQLPQATHHRPSARAHLPLFLNPACCKPKSCLSLSSLGLCSCSYKILTTIKPGLRLRLHNSPWPNMSSCAPSNRRQLRHRRESKRRPSILQKAASSSAQHSYQSRFSVCCLELHCSVRCHVCGSDTCPSYECRLECHPNRQTK